MEWFTKLYDTIIWQPSCTTEVHSDELSQAVNHIILDSLLLKQIIIGPADTSLFDENYFIRNTKTNKILRWSWFDPHNTRYNLTKIDLWNNNITFTWVLHYFNQPEDYYKPHVFTIDKNTFLNSQWDFDNYKNQLKYLLTETIPVEE